MRGVRLKMGRRCRSCPAGIDQRQGRYLAKVAPNVEMETFKSFAM